MKKLMAYNSLGIAHMLMADHFVYTMLLVYKLNTLVQKT